MSDEEVNEMGMIPRRDGSKEEREVHFDLTSEECERMGGVFEESKGICFVDKIEEDGKKTFIKPHNINIVKGRR